MPNFLRNLSLFAGLLLAYWGSMMLLNACLNQSSLRGIEASRVLLLGDSHIQYGLDPTLFQEANNVGQTAEPLVVSFWKLKRIARDMHLDTVLLGFAPHNLSSFNDAKFKSDSIGPELLQRIHPIADGKVLCQQFGVTPKTLWHVRWKDEGWKPNLKRAGFLGQYQAPTKTNIHNAAGVYRRHFFVQGNEAVASPAALAYFDSIVAFCHRHRIQLIALETPTHASYRDRIPPVFLNLHDQVLTKHRDGLQRIPEYPEVLMDTMFYDADHLNRYGAEVYSQWVKAALAAGLQH